VGSHCVLRLLAAGYRVRTTVRSLAREGQVREMIRVGGGDPGEALSFAAADLTSDAGWAEAVAGCAYVLHVASPFPPAAPKNDDELVIPARDGTLRVLRAARDAGVKRVVVTSSFAAVGYGHPPQGAPFDETVWTDPEGVRAYVKSKTIAERAAWDFVAREGNGLELAVINPTAILGPVLGPDLSTSIVLVQRLLSGAMPGCPQLWFGVVDVRDLAELHLLAMTRPEARGERFLALSGQFVSIREMALALKASLGERAARVPTRQLPNWLVRLAALREPALKQIAPELGKRRDATNAKARRVLGWDPRPPEEALVATAESLLRLGLVAAR
ncbi:MAG: aldehyde reductase, partial [Myxococcota bacterium]